MLALIAAVAANGVIGRDGRIPWQIPGEQKRFRALTTGNTVIMGRRTYEEIGRPLPGRDTIVVSTTATFEGASCRTARSLPEALRMVTRGDAYVCGGAGLYGEALPLADVLYLTELTEAYEGDTLFPAFDPAPFLRTVEEVTPEYAYVTYTRRKD